MQKILKVKRISEDTKLPSYAHEGDAALDLFSREKIIFKPGEKHTVPTGVVMEIPEGHAGLIWDKSGLSINQGLKTLGGVVDATYRGEVMVGIINLSNQEYVLEKGHKVAQMIIQKVEHVIVDEVENLSDTSRGEGGFGSTGK